MKRSHRHSLNIPENGSSNETDDRQKNRLFFWQILFTTAAATGSDIASKSSDNSIERMNERKDGRLLPQDSLPTKEIATFGLQMQRKYSISELQY